MRPGLWIVLLAAAVARAQQFDEEPYGNMMGPMMDNPYNEMAEMQQMMAAVQGMENVGASQGYGNPSVAMRGMLTKELAEKTSNSTQTFGSIGGSSSLSSASGSLASGSLASESSANSSGSGQSQEVGGYGSSGSAGSGAPESVSPASSAGDSGSTESTTDAVDADTSIDDLIKLRDDTVNEINAMIQKYKKKQDQSKNNEKKPNSGPGVHINITTNALPAPSVGSSGSGLGSVHIEVNGKKVESAANTGSSSTTDSASATASTAGSSAAAESAGSSVTASASGASAAQGESSAAPSDTTATAAQGESSAAPSDTTAASTDSDAGAAGAALVEDGLANQEVPASTTYGTRSIEAPGAPPTSDFEGTQVGLAPTPPSPQVSATLNMDGDGSMVGPDGNPIKSANEAVKDVLSAMSPHFREEQNPTKVVAPAIRYSSESKAPAPKATTANEATSDFW